MKYKYIHNYTITPKKIYDGPEPNSISYYIEDLHKKKMCKCDLWNDGSVFWREWFSEGEYTELCDFLDFPTMKWGNETNIAAHVVHGPVYLLRCTEKESFFFVYYTIFEKQPSRYQCFVLAVFESIKQ